MFLSQIQSLRLAAVLEQCSDQLDILGRTLTLQTSREQETANTEEKARLAKVHRDCQYISQQIIQLHLELVEKQRFGSLQQLLEEEEQKKKAEKKQREAKKELEQKERNIHRMQEELQQKEEKIQELQQRASKLRYQLKDQALQNARKKKIAEKSMERQVELTKKENIQTEQRLEDKLQLLHKQVKEELRVQKESRKFLENQHEELQEKLRLCKQQTKQLLLEREQQLNSVSCKKTVNFDRLAEMRRKFREMEQVVMEDREEQEKLRKQEEEARAATKLQAWWRGCMVRRGLGSFKKSEEDKKGKKKKKKEGKKKKK